jgi:hypothetical protein
VCRLAFFPLMILLVRRILAHDAYAYCTIALMALTNGYCGGMCRAEKPGGVSHYGPRSQRHDVLHGERGREREGDRGLHYGATTDAERCATDVLTDRLQAAFLNGGVFFGINFSFLVLHFL